MVRRFDIGDEVYHVGKPVIYKITKIYEHPNVCHYVQAERISVLFLNSSTQIEFMVDEHLRAMPLTRKTLIEKWKK